MEWIISGFHFLLELFVAVFPIEMNHPLIRAVTFKKFAKFFTFFWPVFAAGRWMSRRIFVQALPVFVTIIPTCFSLRLIRKSHFQLIPQFRQSNRNDNCGIFFVKRNFSRCWCYLVHHWIFVTSQFADVRSYAWFFLTLTLNVKCTQSAGCRR